MTPFGAVQIVSHEDPTVIWLGLELVANAGTPVLMLIPLLRVTQRPVAVATVASLAGLGIDIDHIISAGSISIEQMIAIPGRPWTHSILFCSIIAALPLLTRRSGWWSLALAAGFSTHLLRDASGGGTPLFWPLKEPDGVPWLSYPLGCLVLLGASWMIARQVKKRRE